MKYPLITKWLPGLELVNGHKSGPEHHGYTKYVLAEHLERELEKGVVKFGNVCGDHGWWDKPTYHSMQCEGEPPQQTHEALLIGARPIQKERKATLTEAQVREVFKHYFYKYDESAFLNNVISALFGEGGE